MHSFVARGRFRALETFQGKPEESYDRIHGLLFSGRTLRIACKADADTADDPGHLSCALHHLVANSRYSCSRTVPSPAAEIGDGLAVGAATVDDVAGGLLEHPVLQAVRADTSKTQPTATK